MRIAFTSLEEFIEELRTEAGNGAIEDNIVRLTTQERMPNKTTTELTLVAGFSVIGEVRSYSETWTEYAGCESPGEHKAAVREINSVCEELELKVRGGRFEDE